MKKIINKKLYDTSTATCIAEYSGPARVSDFSFYRETLYRKRTGEYFIHGEGGARSRYASYEYGLMSWGEQILPLTYDTARAIGPNTTWTRTPIRTSLAQPQRTIRAR